MADGSITDEQAHEWLEDISKGAWISLHYDNPTLGGEDKAEISGGGYTRYKMPFSQPSNRGIHSTEDARFTGLVQTKLVYFGIWNKKGAGSKSDPARLMAYGELPQPTMVLNGKGYVLHEQMIMISFG